MNACMPVMHARGRQGETRREKVDKDREGGKNGSQKVPHILKAGLVNIKVNL